MTDLAGLGAAVKVCQDCSLHVMGTGVPGSYFVDNQPVTIGSNESGYKVEQMIKRVCAADIMFVGEAPGPVEQEKGIPFIGTSGRLLHQLAKEAGVHDYYVSNIAKHFPGRDSHNKIKKPNPETVEACWPFLVKEIRLVRPKWIVLLGGTAAIVLRRLKLVKGNPSMGSMVGRTFRFPYSDISFLVLYHPAHFLYEGGARRTQSQLNEFRRCLMGIRGAEMPKWPWTTDPNGALGSALKDMVVDCETETPGKKPDPRVDKLTQVGYLMLDGEEAFLDLQASAAAAPVYAQAGQRFIFHGGLYDVPVLRRYGWKINEVEDTLAMAYSLGEQDLSLKGLGQEKLGVHTVTYKQAAHGDPNYLAQDVWLGRRLFEYFRPLIRGTAYEIDRQLIPVLADMVFRGYEIDQDEIQQLTKRTEEAMARLERVWYRTYSDVKISSPLKIAKVLGLPNTDKETLGPLGTWESEVILAWRKQQKLLTTYLRPIQEQDTLTGLFNLYPDESGEGGTGTGRLSSRDQNLQNLHPAIQRCLRAPEGYVLLRADYAQIELRVAAEVSEDETLLKAYQEGRDLHEETRAALGIRERTLAKRVNFAGLYLAGAPRIGQLLGIPRAEAEAILAGHRRLWPGFYAWADRHWAEVQRSGYSVAMAPFLHRRFIPLLAGDHARKAAVNHPIQSGASYIVKVAMIEVAKEYPKLVNQVHDEIHPFVPEDEAEVAKRRVEEIMVEVGNKYLPRVGAAVDVKVGRYWE